MTLNKVDTSAMTQTHLVDPYGPTRQQKNDTNVASPKDTGNQAPSPPLADQADISAEAHKLVDLKKAVDVGRAAMARETDDRSDRIAQVKERLTSGFYQSAEVRDQVAGRISSLFFDGRMS